MSRYEFYNSVFDLVSNADENTISDKEQQEMYETMKVLMDEDGLNFFDLLK